MTRPDGGTAERKRGLDLSTAVVELRLECFGTFGLLNNPSVEDRAWGLPGRSVPSARNRASTRIPAAESGEAQGADAGVVFGAWAGLGVRVDGEPVDPLPRPEELLLWTAVIAPGHARLPGLAATWFAAHGGRVDAERLAVLLRTAREDSAVASAAAGWILDAALAAGAAESLWVAAGAAGKGLAAAAVLHGAPRRSAAGTAGGGNRGTPRVCTGAPGTGPGNPTEAAGSPGLRRRGPSRFLP